MVVHIYDRGKIYFFHYYIHVMFINTGYVIRLNMLYTTCIPGTHTQTQLQHREEQLSHERLKLSTLRKLRKHL